MPIRTRIRIIAWERGLTAAALARQLGLYRSNLSAMDAGRRAISLRTLARLARALDCSPGELLELGGAHAPSVFHGTELNMRLAQRDLNTPDGAERAWVHASLLAWQRHYRARP